MQDVTAAMRQLGILYAAASRFLPHMYLAWSVSDFLEEKATIDTSPWQGISLSFIYKNAVVTIPKPRISYTMKHYNHTTQLDVIIADRTGDIRCFSHNPRRSLEELAGAGIDSGSEVSSVSVLHDPRRDITTYFGFHIDDEYLTDIRRITAYPSIVGGQNHWEHR